MVMGGLLYYETLLKNRPDAVVPWGLIVLTDIQTGLSEELHASKNHVPH